MGWNYESRESDAKNLRSVHRSSEGEKKKSCKVLTHGTSRAAEGLETIEMESLQRKCVFYYLYDWTGIGKKKIPAGKQWRHSKISKGICRWRDDVRAKTTLFYNSCNNRYQLEFLQPGFFFFVLRMFSAFSLFSLGVFSSVIFVEHLIINLSRLKSYWAVTGENHKPGTCLFLSKVYLWGSF